MPPRGAPRPARRPGPRSLSRSPGVQIVLLAALYYGPARLRLLQQLVRGQATALWPATGLAATALLLLGLRVWPGIAIGAFAVNVTLGPCVGVVLVITAGNTLAPVAAYLMMRRAGVRST